MMDEVSLDTTKNGHRQRKETCPSCGKRQRYVRYFNYTKNEYLPIEFGRCDREQNCGYFNEPWEWLKDGRKSEKPINHAKPEPAPKPKYQYVDKSILKRSLRQYETNQFILWIADIVQDDDAIMDAIMKYMIGTAKNGGTIFWQINRYMQICTGQLIYYGTDGHRRKDVVPAARRLFETKDNYTTCLFGEHLIFDMKPGDLIGLVESEKTAFICSLYLPVLYGRPIHWLATSGVNGITEEKAFALKGKDVVLCPDYSYHARAVWGSVPMRKKRDGKRVLVDPDGDIQSDYVSAKDKLESIGCNVMFYDTRPNTDDGSDIADYLVQSPPDKKILPPTPFKIENTESKVSSLEAARDSGWSEIISAADRMLIDKYGKNGLDPVDYREKKVNLQKQLDLSLNPNIQLLAKTFNCDFDYKY